MHPIIKKCSTGNNMRLYTPTVKNYTLKNLNSGNIMVSIPGHPSVFAIPKTFQHSRRYRPSALKVESTIKFIYLELRSYYPRTKRR